MLFAEESESPASLCKTSVCRVYHGLLNYAGGGSLFEHKR